MIPGDVRLEDIIDRFKNEYELYVSTGGELCRMSFTEYELKELIYLLNEVKTAREVLNNENTF